MTSTFPFPTERHQDEVPPSSIHPTDFDSLTDPALDSTNNVTAAKRWRQPDSLTAPTKYRIWRRNAGNDDWILEGSWGIEEYGEGQVPVADEDGYLWPGDVSGESGPGGPATIEIEDEGVSEGEAGTINFVGSGVTASVAGGVATVTVSTGGGGLTQAYVGYNTIGGSFETAASNSKHYLKQITLADDCLLTSIECYLDAAAGTCGGPSVGVLTDSSGAPDRVIAATPGILFLDLETNARWVAVPIGVWLVAGTYWIGVRIGDVGAAVLPQIAYDATGSDRTYVSGVSAWPDWDNGTGATTANQYSIRANTIL